MAWYLSIDSGGLLENLVVRSFFFSGSVLENASDSVCIEN